ncbi:hypothetical protein [Streptacidiphilus jiangxiensis]|jgi:hypothetical protein|uniref:Uncharacterized protein n=1 Tax=Streptacidiphilus jiangxiensis TaxID=235985 RepID=A0A1H7S736_STRJI|nr:hypothetical protein [Streptacidiphilus jiangxiensis]SEL68355.1 hypothetical protein SAMN05414137_111197 [Streptacidiphilus jiangxiensis]
MTNFVATAAQLAEGNGQHNSLQPWLTGGGALLILLLLLVVTVSFNKDR